MTQESAASQGAPELRAAMVDRLVADGSLTSTRLEAAMREVPRHLFTPGADLTRAYAVDEIVRYRTDDHGVCLSSVSAPWIQAEMIEAAGIEEGMRVLEIGSGGYNAALLSRLVGPSGRVVSVDIDPEAIERAAAGLEAAGIGGIELVLADAEHGVPTFAPYDRIIVTVAAWEVPQAWLAQLAEDGRIVVPLVMRGQQRIIAFERAGTDLVGRAMIYGGFVPMQGAGAHKAFAVGFDDATTLHFDEGEPADVEALRKVLDCEPVTAESGVSVARQEPYDSLQLYLTAVLPSTARLVFAGPGAGRDLPDPQAGFPVSVYGGGTIAYVTMRQHGQGDTARFELVACGLGAAAADAAQNLRDLVREWDRTLRAGRAQPQVTIAFAGQSVVPGPRQHLLAKTRSTLVLHYPEAPGDAGSKHETTLSLRTAPNGSRPIHGPGPNLPCGLVVIDFEAVTPAGRTPEPIEIAALALRWIGGRWYESARFAALIRPPEGTPIPEINTRITGITSAMLEDARPAAEVLGELDGRLSLPDYRLVAHGAGTEALLLRAQRVHCPRLAATPLIDTVAMARAVLGPRDSYRLDAVLAHYQVPIPPDRHRAGADVTLTAQIFLRLLADGWQAGRWSDLPGLERAAGRAPAHRPEAGEQMALEVPAR